MQTEAVTEDKASVLSGLLTRDQLAGELRGTSHRTIIRYERAGMPVIHIGLLRLYDPASVRAWLVSHERRHDAPKRGRPRKAA